MGALSAIEVPALRFARTRGHSPALERAARSFTRLGDHAGAWLALGFAGACADAPRRAGWRTATATVAGAYAVNTAVKLAVRRPRPRLPGLPPLVGTPTGLSSPSAHATSSFAAALAYSRLGLPVFPLYALATALALSRLYLGVHYPSDIAAGALLGTAIALGAGRLP